MVFSGVNFYHRHLTRYAAVFGKLFNDIVITRQSADGNINQEMKVPVSFATKEKMLTRLQQFPEADTQIAAQLPRISFEQPRYRYDKERKSVSLSYNATKIVGDNKNLLRTFVPVPYNIDFNVYIYAKNMEDGHKIIEQILPFFTPDFTIRMKLVDEMNDERDIPINLIGDVEFEDHGQENDPKTRRVLVWTLKFLMNAWFFGPVKTRPIIKLITLNTRIDDQIVTDENPEVPLDPNTNPIATQTVITPGLDANGNPTSNSSVTVNADSIAIDSNFGYIVEVTLDPQT